MLTKNSELDSNARCRIWCRLKYPGRSFLRRQILLREHEILFEHLLRMPQSTIPSWSTLPKNNVPGNIGCYIRDFHEQHQNRYYLHMKRR